MNQARAFSETSQKLEEKSVNSGTDVENVLPQPLEENDEDAVKVGEKRKCEEEKKENRAENTTDVQVNDSKRLKTDSVVDHDKAVKQSILDLFVPENRHEYYEDIDNNNQVLVEAFMLTDDEYFKDYLRWLVKHTEESDHPCLFKLSFLIKTAMESCKRACDKGELPDLFNESYVAQYVEALDPTPLNPTKINALIENSLGGETGDETESQPNTVCPTKDNGTEDGMDTELQSNTLVPSVCMTTTYYENLDAYYEHLDAAGNVNDHTGDLSNDN